MPPVARLISLGILTSLIVALGITFYQVLAPFLLPLFLAWIVAIVCRPLYLWCVKRTGNRPRIAAGVTTAGIFLVVLLPLAVGTVVAAAQLIGTAEEVLKGDEAGAAQGSDQNQEQLTWREGLDRLTRLPVVIKFAERIEPYLAHVPVESEPAETNAGFPSLDDGVQSEESGTKAPDEKLHATAGNALDKEAARQQLERRIDATIRRGLKYVGVRTIGAVGTVSGVALGILGTLVSLIVAVVMFAIGLYYFLCDGPELLAAAEHLIPVESSYQRELLDRFNQVVRAVVLSTFLSALAQGILTTFALGVVGYHYLVILFLLSSLVAMIPVAGTWVVWIPCVLWLAFWEKSYGQAIFVAAFCTAVVGTADNLIRTYILNSSAKLHPLLAFVSVLGGLQVMGLWGVFIGPIVAACLHALIQIFNTELSALSEERLANQSASATDAALDNGAANETASREKSSPQEADAKEPGPATAEPEPARSGE